MDIEFICNKHKEYGIQTTKLRNIERNQCCHICGKEKSSKSREVNESELKLITEEKGFIFVGRSKNENGRSVIDFICTKHIEKGIQHKLIADMKRSNGKCNYCLGHNKTHEDFVKQIAEINPNIEILNEYKHSKDMIKCRCKIDGYEWNCVATALVSGSGCKKCSTLKTSIGQMHSEEWFLHKINEIHPNIEILSKYSGMKNKIECRCRIDGNVWNTTPDGLINNNSGCRVCSNKLNGERCKKSNEEFIEQLKNINPNIIPLEEYIDDHAKIKCKCLIHNYVWKVAPNKILHKIRGCPKCKIYANELKITKILDKWGFNYECQKKFDNCKDKRKLPFDIYLNEFNACIEYDGEDHYFIIKRSHKPFEELLSKFEDRKRKDLIKTKYCKNNNIKLIRIPYWESNDLEYYLFNKLVSNNIIEEITQ